MFGLSELVVILLVVIAVLAVRKLPGLTRSAGQAKRIFTRESTALRDENPKDGTPRTIPGTVVDREEPKA
ncbi:twin-arginine translocase TatA/TatE family subunit [Streptomyces griseoaurantiacus]|uniref:twin-arginine translocase TatA/TatE family subunit n=1 Tax=Streptomyces griseoaurantiacus TaxID=68213 RepID=UPI0036A34A17